MTTAISSSPLCDESIACTTETLRNHSFSRQLTSRDDVDTVASMAHTALADTATNAPEVSQTHSTLEVVEDHPDAKKFAYSQAANGLQPTPNSTLEVSHKDDFSTLESYRNPDKDPTSEKIALHPTAEEDEELKRGEKKEGGWRRRRVCGVPLLFWAVALALVVVVAAVVGGVMGSRAQPSGTAMVDSTAAASTSSGASTGSVITTVPVATPTSTSNPSDPFFTGSVLCSVFTQSQSDARGRRFLESATPHNRTPSDGVFIGSMIGNLSLEAELDKALPESAGQRWDVGYLPDELKAEYLPQSGQGNTPFYLRLHGTNLAAQIDDVVWDSIDFGNRPNASRRDVPIVLREFKAEEKNQMWYLGVDERTMTKDSILNLGLFNENWTMGGGPDDRAAMVLEGRQEDELVWRLFALAPRPGSAGATGST